MTRIILLSLVLLSVCGPSMAQSTLFDESRVSSVYIEISPDSLEYIMENVLSDHYFGARFIYDYGAGRDTLANVGFRLRGNTSRFSQKKSFKLSFNEYVQGRKYQGVKKINLNGQHNDPTMIREKLFYDTWKKAGMAERRTSFVRLYINGNYYGLYTNLEEFDKDWLERVFAENDGNLYKCTYPADLAFISSNPQAYKDIMSTSATGGRAYDLQTNETADDYRDLAELITYLNQPADSLFAIHIADLLNVDGALKAFALDVASGNWDDYMYNKNNYFLYHNQTTGKFEFISYDTDNTFGVDWVNKDWATRNCLTWYSNTEPRPLARKLLAVPAFNYRYRCYLDTIARKIILPDSIFPHINYMQSLVTTAAIADTYRTLDYGYTVNDFVNGFTQTIDGHTPYGIKPFLTLRKSKILEQLAANSLPDPQTGKQELFSIYPNPVNETIFLSIPKGSGTVHVTIFDCMGKKWSEFDLEDQILPFSIPLSRIPAGLYILSIDTNGRSQSKKFVRQ